jgi:hypothetical protein
MKAKDLGKIFDDGEVDMNEFLDLSKRERSNVYIKAKKRSQ